MSRHALRTVLFIMMLSAQGAQVNVTVDDSDPSIVYAPPASWNSSQIVCTSCNNPPVLLAFQQTYHKGVHVAPPDVDDTGSASQPSPTSTHPPSSTPPSAPNSSATPDDDGPGKGPGTPDHDNDADDHPSKRSSPTSPLRPPPAPPSDDDPKTPPGSPDNDVDNHSRKRSSYRRADVHLPRLDLDDAGFVDQPVSAQFNFTGTAVYIFCIQPLGLTLFPSPPSLMNITFLLDNAAATTFVHQGSASGTGFASGVNVFAKQGLEDGPHALNLSLAPNSGFVLDYVIITQNIAAAAQTTPEPDLSSATSATVESQISSASPTSESDRTTKNGRASFAGAVAGSLGVLGIICFGTAFSIYRRRKLAARRDRLERRAAPPMTGVPGSFIPRYFPGTVVSTTPPPYAPSDASSSSSLGHAAEPLLTAHAPTYADIPPPLDELAPPPFGVALAAPAVRLLDGGESAQIVSSGDQPPSWGADPHMVALPTSRATSLFTADDDRV